MRVARALVYPNGRRKSELYDLYVSHRSFWCTPEKFEEDLQSIILEERLGTCQCEWYRDTDGRHVVSGLDLRDPGARVVITRDGFVVADKPGAESHLFISYAHEDYEEADRIGVALARAGFRPWIDRDNLLAGQDSKREIEKVIKKSDLFIPILSSRSVGKRGFVQREIRRALEVADEVPGDRMYILPVRTDPCDSQHTALRNLHVVDLFPDWDNGIRTLIRSVCSARESTPTRASEGTGRFPRP